MDGTRSKQEERMPERVVLSTAEVAEAKNCSRQTVYNAIQRDALSGMRAGKVWFVVKDEKYQAFRPKTKHHPYPHRND